MKNPELEDTQVMALDVVKGGAACAKARLCGYRLTNSGRNVELLTSLPEFAALAPDVQYSCVKMIDVAEDAAREAEEYIAKEIGAVI